MQKSQYILVGIAALLAIFVLVFAIASYFRPEEQLPSQNEAAPTPTSAVIPTIQYDKSSSDKMLEILKTREALNSDDVSIRSQLIKESQKATYLYSSENIRVEYLSAPDEFLAEILIGDVTKAKTEMVNFFSDKGLSRDGICHLPLIFFLSSSARRSLPANAPAFNPLPDDC